MAVAQAASAPTRTVDSASAGGGAVSAVASGGGGAGAGALRPPAGLSPAPPAESSHFTAAPAAGVLAAVPSVASAAATGGKGKGTAKREASSSAGSASEKEEGEVGLSELSKRRRLESGAMRVARGAIRGTR
jgi:hypothetical protein